MQGAAHECITTKQATASRLNVRHQNSDRNNAARTPQHMRELEKQDKENAEGSMW
jgi:hypothetical protein